MTNLLLAAMLGLAVFVTTPNGTIDVCDSVPNVCAESGTELHIEIVRGYVADNDANGMIVWSTDGPIDANHNYISYGGLPVVYGDGVTSVFVLETDANGEWCDDIVLRADIIDGVTLDMIEYTP